MTTEELELTTYEIEMVLLEDSIKQDNLRSKNWFVRLIKRIFGGNL